MQALATEDDDASAVPAATPASDRSLAATGTSSFFGFRLAVAVGLYSRCACMRMALAADLFDETDAVRLVAPALAELRIIKHDYAVLQELAQLESAGTREGTHTAAFRLWRLGRAALTGCTLG